MDLRETRLAENEIAFREINEEIGAASEQARPGDPLEILCECSHSECTLQLRVSRAGYEIARKRGDQFLIVPWHVQSEIEEVVFRMKDYAIVQKRGEAGELAKANNPRAF